MEDLEGRLTAVERALTDEKTNLDGLDDAAALGARVDDVEDRPASVESRLDTLDGATQALRGYVGAVRAVNDDVERRADLALAKAEELERVVGVAPEEEMLSAVESYTDERVGTGGKDRANGRDGADEKDEMGVKDGMGRKDGTDEDTTDESSSDLDENTTSSGSTDDLLSHLREGL